MTGFRTWLEALEMPAQYQPKVFQPAFVNPDKPKFLRRRLKTIEMAKEVAEKNGKPRPTTFLARGSHADVFNTEDPNVVVRVGPTSTSDCEKVLEQPHVQATGAVVRSLGSYELMSPAGRPYLVTFKEKVKMDGWQHLVQNIDITKLHDVDPNIEKDHGDLMDGHDLLRNVNFDHFVKGGKMTLKSVADFLRGTGPVMGNLAKAVEAGVPLKDMHDGNVGMNSQGKLVVIDC